jgi:hypothetical protein
MYNKLLCQVKSNLSSSCYIRSVIFYVGRLDVAMCHIGNFMVKIQ